MDIDLIQSELANMKNKNKIKKKKLPEKFKNYTEEVSQPSCINLDKYNEIYKVIITSEINQINTELSNDNIKNLEKYSLEQVSTIIDEEFEGNEEIYKNKKMTKKQMDEMISHIDSLQINKYEHDSDEDLEIIEEILPNSQSTSKNNNKKLEQNQIPMTENLNEKYNFKIGEINYADIEFFKDKKKILYKSLT